MRRIARVAGAVSLALVAAAVASPVSVAAGPLNLDPVAGSERHVVMDDRGPGEAGRTWGYWGRFTGTETGSYRATCAWLAESHWGDDPKPDNRDNRLLCTVVFAFRFRAGSTAHSDGGSIVAHGLVKLPHGDAALFARSSWRRLAVTGGTAQYAGRAGSVDRRTHGKRIVISFVGP
jgi:hypothetical protein